ncbi:co-chaperone protein p23-1-like isoform X1 [Tasmannia lanceolata]|uniref:co-chaperone protein p23-1-like isoform X1 n=1 Tax=Tasmannia lanceolata TaxID=3420 RepID=UPI0040632C70
MSRHPTVKWAQSSDKIYLTVELPDAKDINVKLEPEGKFIFSASKGGTLYEVDIELYDKINIEESKASIGPRNIVYVIKKTEKKSWSRLLKQEGKSPVFLKVDWDKWVDEEDEERGGIDLDDMDFSKLDMGEDDFDMDDDPNDEEEGIQAKEEDQVEKQESIAVDAEKIEA